MVKKIPKIYKIILFFILVIFAIILFLIAPIVMDIKEKSKELVHAKKDLINLSNQLEATNYFKARYSQYKDNFDKMDKLFVDQDNPVKFIEFLEDTASNSDIASKISISTPSSDQSKFIIFQVISKGRFSDILNFIRNVENGPYLVEIKELNIKNSDVETSQNTDKKDTQNKKEIDDYSHRDVDATFLIKVFTKL